jgi:hypothetical protein
MSNEMMNKIAQQDPFIINVAKEFYVQDDEIWTQAASDIPLFKKSLKLTLLGIVSFSHLCLKFQEQMIVKETLKENLMSEIHSLTLC